MSASQPSVKRPVRDRRRAARRAQPDGGNDRAQTMMTVALDLFAERNFATVTIKDIGKELGVNTALIYYYFESKEDLFRASIESAVQRAFDHFRELRNRHQNPADIIDDWLHNHVDLHEPIQKLVKVSLDYASLPIELPEVERSIAQFYDEELRMLESCIRKGVESGQFRTVDPQSTARLVSTYLDGLMVRTKIFPDFDLEAAVAALRDTLWDHLRYTPGA